MCKSPKKLFKSVGKAFKGAVGIVPRALLGAISPKAPKAEQQPVQAQAAQDPTQYLQEQTQANADAALANRRRRRGPGAATPSFLSAGANRGIITGGASLLGGGQ